MPDSLFCEWICSQMDGLSNHLWDVHLQWCVSHHYLAWQLWHHLLFPHYIFCPIFYFSANKSNVRLLHDALNIRNNQSSFWLKLVEFGSPRIRMTTNFLRLSRISTFFRFAPSLLGPVSTLMTIRWLKLLLSVSQITLPTFNFGYKCTITWRMYS